MTLKPNTETNAEMRKRIHSSMPPAPNETTTYKLTYFRKDGGRYYSEGVVNLFGLYGDAIRQTREIVAANALPGMVEGTPGQCGYDVLLEDVQGLPHLIRDVSTTKGKLKELRIQVQKALDILPVSGRQCTDILLDALEFSE